MTFPMWAVTSICPDLLALETSGTVQQITNRSVGLGLSFEAAQRCHDVSSLTRPYLSEGC